MEDALYDSVAVQRFVGLAAQDPRPDETTILHFRHLLERHHLGEGLLAEITHHLAAQGLRLREGMIVDATILDAPASTKHRAQARDPEMHQVQKGNQWYCGMKAHLGVDAATGLVQSVVTTAANVADITQGPRLLHGAETRVWGRLGVCGRGPAARSTEAGGSTGRWRGGRGAAALGARQRRCPGGAAQGLDPGEGGASVPVCEAPLRLCAGAVSGIGQEPDSAVPVVGVRQSAAGGARCAGVSRRSAPRAGAHPACTATWRRPQPRNAVPPTPPRPLANAPQL